MELSKFQIKTIEKFIRCGDPKHGFAWLECPKCYEAFLVPFSCKTKVCNSCGEKASLVWAEWAASEVMLNANHRHITMTIPKVLREYFYKNRLLLKKYLETAAQTINFVYSLPCPDPTARLGMIAVLHTAGSALNWNPHTILTEGLLSDPRKSCKDEKTDDTGELLHYPLPVKDYIYINRLWRNRVLALLKNMRFITDYEAEEYKEKYPYGFHVDVRFRATSDVEEREKSEGGLQAIAQ